MDVPEDIREKAQLVWADAVEQSRREGTVIDVSVLIAQALLAERLAQRERDAKIVEQHKDVRYLAPQDDWCANVGQRLAAAIRQS